MRILVVEDNRSLNQSLRMSLEEDGHAVDASYDGSEGQYLAEVTPYDVIILDIMLPGKNGLEVCRELRQKGVRTPVLMLTARDTVEDRVTGLDSGADDYLVKPFALPELRARLRALLRARCAGEEQYFTGGRPGDGPCHPQSGTQRAGNRPDIQGICPAGIFHAQSRQVDHTRNGRTARVGLRF